jgi:glyoxylate/hydroxypyruvate reductase A
MSVREPTVLVLVPVYRAGEWSDAMAAAGINAVVHGRDVYAPEAIDYVLSFRPPPGLLKSLPNLKVVFSLGAGVDGFLADPEFPKHVPLVRFVDNSLSTEMAQYVLLHVLIVHRSQRELDAAQRESKWAQTMLPRRTQDTRVGILGLGEIGTVSAGLLVELGFAVSGWSRTPKNVAGVKSFAGAEMLGAFLAQCDILVCLLPLTPDTRGILNAKTFGMLPKGAFVINAARGGHVVESDVIPAIDSGHLSGVALDVFETEPLPATSPLWRHPKVTVTPHIAAISELGPSVHMVVDGIRRHQRGEKLLNVVDVSRGY